MVLLQIMPCIEEFLSAQLTWDPQKDTVKAIVLLNGGFIRLHVSCGDGTFLQVVGQARKAGTPARSYWRLSCIWNLVLCLRSIGFMIVIISSSRSSTWHVRMLPAGFAVFVGCLGVGVVLIRSVEVWSGHLGCLRAWGLGGCHDNILLKFQFGQVRCLEVWVGHKHVLLKFQFGRCCLSEFSRLPKFADICSTLRLYIKLVGLTGVSGYEEDRRHARCFDYSACYDVIMM